MPPKKRQKTTKKFKDFILLRMSIAIQMAFGDMNADFPRKRYPETICTADVCNGFMAYIQRYGKKYRLIVRTRTNDSQKFHLSGKIDMSKFDIIYSNKDGTRRTDDNIRLQLLWQLSKQITYQRIMAILDIHFPIDF